MSAGIRSTLRQLLLESERFLVCVELVASRGLIIETRAKAAHAVEQTVKIIGFDCRDCGDCSLPSIAYLCPEW